jgi:hypothetical protein
MGWSVWAERGSLSFSEGKNNVSQNTQECQPQEQVQHLSVLSELLYFEAWQTLLARKEKPPYNHQREQQTCNTESEKG